MHAYISVKSIAFAHLKYFNTLISVFSVCSHALLHRICSHKMPMGRDIKISPPQLRGEVSLRDAQYIPSRNL